MEQLPITEGKDYKESLSKILRDVQLWCGMSRRKTWVKLPNKLLDRITASDSFDLAYEKVRAGISHTVQNYCEIVEWDRGEDESGQYIKFSILPERIEDEV